MVMTTWRKILERKLANEGDDLIKDLTFGNAASAQLDNEFENDWGSPGIDNPFFAWSERWVYFSLEYDGRLSISRVPRHPGGDAGIQGHV